MKRFISISIILFHVLGALGLERKFPEPNWQIISSKYPTNNTIIAGYSVIDFGAKGDGITDDSKAFQQALRAMRYHGGGVVFVPEGEYLICNSLDIYENVTLRGEWKTPDNDGIYGTVLMVKTANGDENAKPFINLYSSAGIKDVNIWYPEQDAQEVKIYPWCIQQSGPDHATVENVTMVNPYLGIRIGPNGNALHYVHNVYGTPLKTGLQVDQCYDIGRLENIQFNPNIWSLSKLPGAPDNKDILSFTQKSGTGVIMYRSDWEYGFNVRVDGYNTGFNISGSPQFDLESGAPESYPNAQFYNFEFINCEKAVYVKGANPYGIMFTKSFFQGNEIGFETAETFNSVVQFQDCKFSGRQQSIKNSGNGHLALQHCFIDKGELIFLDGSASILDSKMSYNVSAVNIMPNVKQSEFLGNEIDSNIKLKYDHNNAQIKFGQASYPFYQLPEYLPGQERDYRPAKEKLYVITKEPYFADMSGGEECHSIIQKAIDDAFENGGGIVFFPAGSYKVSGNIELKEGVELRGISEVPHHTKYMGSVLKIETGKGEDADSEAFIRMKSRSGIQGMCFHYPGQSYTYVTPFPFMIRGEGDNIYVVNITATNPYQMLDFASYRCDNHYLSYVAGAPLSVGLKIGKGSKNGYVKNFQFNPHYWTLTNFDNAPKYEAWITDVWEYQAKNLDAIILGDVKEQTMFQNFVFGSLYGIHLIEENGKGPSGYIHGQGSDGAEISANIEGVGKDGISFVNTQLVTVLADKQYYIYFNPGEKKSLGFYNTLFWGTPVETLLLKSGQLNIQLANFHKSGRYGIQVSGGDLYLANTYFWSLSRYIRVYPNSSKPKLMSNFYRTKKREFPLELELRKLPTKPPLPDVYLSDIEYITAIDQISNQPKKNTSIRGNPIIIDGKTYEKGLGVHADSEIVYTIKDFYKRFVAVVGLDDEVLTYKNFLNTMVIYQVWIDDELKAESPEMMMEENRIWYFDIPVPKASKTIKLKVIGFGQVDHADWADSGFITK